MKKEQLKTDPHHCRNGGHSFGKWLMVSILCGIAAGIAEAAFCYCVDAATVLRTEYPVILLVLPFGGLFIIGLYHFFHNEDDTGTNRILASIHSREDVPLRILPCIFLAAVVTHLFGGSAGRAGATLQIGGSIGSGIGKWLRLDESDRPIVTLCGMSAAFSVLFGVPAAAVVFPIEAAGAKNMWYLALLPCTAASFTAFVAGTLCGRMPYTFLVADIPAISVETVFLAILLAACCAFVSRLFCTVLHKSRQLYGRFLKNPYLRITVGGIAVIILTALVGSQKYNGAGMEQIGGFLEKENVFPAAFLLKILFTACTAGAGFKGGEIGPAFYIGASFGCLFGMASGLSASLSIAAGMAAVFCGVTNSPLASLLICIEFFGYGGIAYYLPVIAVSYALSGRLSLYNTVSEY